MVASVLNPPVKRKGRKDASSIMPVLARSFPECVEVEALIRPRMPVRQPRRGEEGESQSEGDEDEDMQVEVPDTYATNKNEAALPLNQSTTSNSAQNSSMAEQAPEPAPQSRPQPQSPSQHSQPTTIPETQSFVTSPKKRAFDSASESQVSSRPSMNTSFEPALAQSFASPKNTMDSTFAAKRPRLDEGPTATGAGGAQGMDGGSIVAETQGMQPTLAAVPVPAIPTTELSAPQPVLTSEKQGGGEGNSSDDEDFEIPAIDPTMDTDEEDESEDDD